MEQVSRIGMDTSKHIFQLHGVDAAERPVLRRKLRRRDMIAFFERLSPTRVAIEACGASHHWARLLRGFGHEAAWCTDRLVGVEELGGVGERPFLAPDAHRAVQAQPGLPPPHPSPAAQGYELAGLRRQLTSAWQP